MADFQVIDKNLLTAVDRSADSLLIYDVSATALKRTTTNYLLDLTSHPVGIDDVQTLTNKTITAPTISNPVLSGTVTGTYTIGGTPTFPSSVVTLTGSQTLTNKVLTSPTINTATIINPTLTVDTVSEFTSANGVTIDGLSIKDGKLNTNDSVVTANITGSSITNAKLSTAAGEPGGVWETLSPTPGGFSAAPSGAFYRCKKVGRTVTFVVTQPNAGTSDSTSFTIPLPYQAANVGTGMEWRALFSQPFNNGATDGTTAGIAIIVNNATTVTLYRSLNGNLWTASGGKRVPSLTIIYEAAA